MFLKGLGIKSNRTPMFCVCVRSCVYTRSCMSPLGSEHQQWQQYSVDAGEGNWIGRKK